jgi:hypothetical protein
MMSNEIKSVRIKAAYSHCGSYRVALSETLNIRQVSAAGGTILIWFRVCLLATIYPVDFEFSDAACPFTDTHRITSLFDSHHIDITDTI